MKGYVRNKTGLWTHAMKRAIAPGAKIPLDELYEQYGLKYNLSEGEEFIRWLNDVKLRDKEKWEVFYDKELVKADEGLGNEALASEKEEVKKATVERSRGENVTPIVPKKLTIADIVGLSVRKARETIKNINDIQLLKYAVKEANQLSGKDSLCIILRKRITELEVSSRR